MGLLITSNLNWLLSSCIVLLAIYLINKKLQKKRILKLKQSLIDNWGKVKKEEIYNFKAIDKYFKNNSHKNKAYHIISDKTQTDLDLNELFKFIDRTTSRIGQQYLYFKIRTIGAIEKLATFEKLTSIFVANQTTRINSQLYLSKLSGYSNYNFEELINGYQIKTPKIIWLVKLLSFLSVSSIIVGFFTPFALLILPFIYLVNLVFHYRNKPNIEYYIDGVSELSKTLKVAKKIATQKEIKTLFSDFSFIRKIEAIKTKTEFIRFEKALGNEYAMIWWFLIEQIKIVFNIEYLVFYSFINDILKERDSIEKLFTFIGEIDCAISTASVKAGKLTTCSPVFNNTKEIKSQQLTHPLIENCVTNNLSLNNNSMLLTGSNMSGKTTFIRTLAINSLFAQTLYFCFAHNYNAPFFKLHTSIRIADDILNSRSYYLEEVITIKKLITASEDKAPCLFILDEIFKGTNTIERISGGKGILSYLNKGNNMVFVATHDIELCTLLSNDYYKLYHFHENIKNDKLNFDYKLKEGPVTTRNAIKILEIYHYPKEVIVEARKIEQNIDL